MQKDRLQMLNDILGVTKDRRDSYYVYALYENDNAMPFYIGKGHGKRVLSHQKEAEEYLKILEEENLCDQEKNILSRKVKTILKNNSKIKHVIVKFGLTGPEAFKVESALMNLFNFSLNLNGDEELTNIVSGHSTTLEKEAVSKDGAIKAREINDFIDNYALPKFEFDEIKEKCVFIKINKTFTSQSTMDDIYQHTRGIWNLTDSKREELEYAISLYKGICVGVFKIDGWVKGSDWSLDYPFPTRDSKDEETIVKYSDIKLLEKEEPELYEKYFMLSKAEDNTEETLQKKLTNWRKRYYFYGTYSEDDIPAHLKEAINKRINYSNKNLYTQSACIYNF